MAIIAKKKEDKDIQAVLLLRNPENGHVTAIGAQHVDAIPALRMKPKQKHWHKIITLTLEDIVPIPVSQRNRWLGK
jgi:hypothetical protein